MAPGEITAAWLSSVLGGEIEGVEQQPIGDGHVSTTIRLSLTTSDPTMPSSIVAKVPAEDERSRILAASVRSYEREVLLFRELAPTVDIRMPHCYHGEWDPATNDYVVLLEDLSPAEQGDQIAGCSLDRAELAVRELTKLHGPRWNDPTLADIDWLSGNDTGTDSGGAAEGYSMIWSALAPAFMASYESYLTPEQLELTERFGEHLVRFIGERERPFSLVHTDYRLDNMMFGTPAGGAPIAIVDWGSPAHSTPVTDLSYFCGAGLLVDDRREHERALLDVYADALGAYDVVVDRDWLWDQYRREAFHGLFIVVFTSQTVTMNDRSMDMFGAMASRHLQHALDLDSLAAL